MMARAIFGGDCYLDGYSIYDSPKGYKHIVTFGMTELYADEESFGGEWNKWGYEMTIKLRKRSRRIVSGQSICSQILPAIPIPKISFFSPTNI